MIVPVGIAIAHQHNRRFIQHFTVVNSSGWWLLSSKKQLTVSVLAFIAAAVVAGARSCAGRGRGAGVEQLKKVGNFDWVK